MKFFETVRNCWKRVDKALFLMPALLSVFSVVLLRSAVANDAATIAIDSGMYKTQAIITAASWVGAFIICAIDYSSVVKLSVVYAPFAIGLSLLVFTSLGIEVAGDKAWLDLKFTTIQPSELLKIAFITTFAMHLSHVGENINKIGSLLLLLLHAAVPMGIVFLQGDDGTLLVFALIAAIMMFGAGLSWLYIIPCLIALPVVGYLVWNHVMKDFQKMRFLVLFNDELDPLGIGYHQRVSKLALGSGQLTGKGLYGAEYVKVPEVANDFIFSYVGQCFGFIGCAVVLLVFLFICLKILADSRIARDPLGKYICIGVFAMVIIHCMLNVGMVVGKFPVVGVPLPFLSQGGTSALAFYIGIGLVMSTYAHCEKKHKVFYDND